MKFVTEQIVEDLITNTPDGKNSRFLRSSHNLWKRFQNYTKSSPMALFVDDKIVSLIFATFNRNNYTNLYEIVTVEGNEGKGYASQLWSEYIHYSVHVKKMERLKISCTPSSITWHIRNGLIFWGIDSSGSLKSDQPIFATRAEQKSARSVYIKNPSLAYPKPSVIQELKNCRIDSYNFSKKKESQIIEAINKVGNFWLGDQLR